MKIVVDANALFSYFKKEAKARELIIDPTRKHRLEFVSPEFVLEEINKHKDTICSRFDIHSKDFDIMFSSLSLFVKTVKKEDFEAEIPTARKILPEHVKDVPYIALTLFFKKKRDKVALWSNEVRLKVLEEHEIEVYTTQELLEKVGLI
ncbi:MAG: hypothetical protein GWO20_17130 [Candidatus Korarchaeota archaeon]|nr:hypothetical protein [Candidatus Korarchaeota archaeon]NIU85582.1 hypothetical protein [Candidatus Thorarchaeota archaeon]NIW15126.1 hypothetical protein [Candidatus Thorarchaeota archaeon]NIW53131.1 hypothetical protein [Candidatus Korarchaeota archaeon]